MIKPIPIKYLITAAAFCLIVLPIYAQQINHPFQITPSFGTPMQFLNKDIYSGKPLNFSSQFGLAINKPISKKINLGIDAQYNRFNLGQNIEQTYQRFISNGSVKNFSPSSTITGIVNIGYTKKWGTKKGSETGIALGAGVQHLTAGGNNLQIPNPFLGNQLTSVYKENEGNYTYPLLQLSLTQSFYIKPCIAIEVGVKAQYVFSNYKTMYKQAPSDTSQQAALDKLFNGPDVITTKQRQFTLIPTIGIRFILGACKSPKPDDNPQQPTASCFGLQWKNAVPKDSCFRGDTLKFAITQTTLIPGASMYEIYIAPVNDLNKEKFLYSLLYPSARFTINPVLLDASTEYVVIVKLRNNNKKLECLQYIRPVKRCADCCKDVNLPGK